MSTFRCVYRDIKNQRRSSVEEYQAEAARDAFEKFIRKRKNEDWSVSEIFSKSLIRIIDEESQEDYVIDAFGEIVKRSERFAIPG